MEDVIKVIDEICNDEIIKVVISNKKNKNTPNWIAIINPTITILLNKNLNIFIKFLPSKSI